MAWSVPCWPSPGQTVTAATALASLVPAGSNLQAHLYAPSSAIGFLHAEQPVLLRYHAFPYQKFGHQHGRIEQVSLAPLQASELAGLPWAGKRARADVPHHRGAGAPAGAGLWRAATAGTRHATRRRRADRAPQVVEWLFEPVLGIAGRVEAGMSAALDLSLAGWFGARRAPVVLQTEAAECALACLAMVAAAHGHRTDLPTLRQRFSLSLKGATMADLVRMASELRFSPRAVRVEPEQLAQLGLPCVLHWDLNHFVVLTAVRGGVAVLHDPARGLRRMKLAELSRHFTGIALELTPAADFSAKTERQSVTLKQLLGPVQWLEACTGADLRARGRRSRPSCC